MFLLPGLKTWSIRSNPPPHPHPELFFKKGVMQIRRKMYTSYVSLWLFSKYTKIPEDLENFIVEENKHES